MVGTTLLHYRIIRKLGQGGMGEVYLAEDTRLKRPVAMKVLPEAVRHDPERLRRFRTEAEAAAKLNHPNIATIYAIEETDALLFITMEYVDGQPLWAHIPSDGLALDQFFAWVLPLTDALAHAHEHGVTHRDLKPGNIMIRVDGVPKILDFGLARITRPETEVEPVVPDPAAVDSQAPTKIMPPKAAPAPPSLTQGPVLLGTPAYMSPEQAERKVVDHRTDLFSFGVVLYEAVTGRRPFEGATLESLIGRILTQEPAPVTGVKPGTPYLLGHVVRQCLQKDREHRIQTARELLTELQDVQQEVQAGTVLVDARTLPPPLPVPEPPAPVPVWRRTPALAGAAVLVALLVALATWYTGERVLAPPEPPLRKFQIPVEGGINPWPVISPDGTMVAYVQGGRLWVRRLDRVDAQEIPDSDGAARPFWSPQSDFVGYFAGGTLTLKKVAAQGGPSTLLCKLPAGGASGATWRPDGTIVFAQGVAGLFAVSGQGGEPRPLMKPDSTRGEAVFRSPHVLPDGRTLVYGVVKTDGSQDLVVQDGDRRRALVHGLPGEALNVPAYAPSGHLLYLRTASGRTDVWAVAFSRSSLTTTGEPFLVAQNAAVPSVSADGTLVYQSAAGGGSTQLVWVDRSGKVEGTIGQPQSGIGMPALSPDGRRVAVTSTESGNADIWIHDVERGTRTPLTSEPAGDNQPAWSPASDQVAFSSGRTGAGDIYTQPANGRSAAHLVVTSPLQEFAPHWSRDGKYLLYHVIDPKTKRDLWYVPLTGSQKPVPFLQTPSEELYPVFSPDGRSVAYESDESGRWEVYVTPFPGSTNKWLVSVKGGVYPKWSGRGNELFYVEYVEGNVLMVVPVETQPGFRVGSPRRLFTGEEVGTQLYGGGGGGNPTGPQYDVTADGQRFVVIRPVGGSTTAMITVVEHWAREFQKQ